MPNNDEIEKEGVMAEDKAKTKTIGECRDKDNEEKVCHQTPPNCAEDKNNICCIEADNTCEGPFTIQGKTESEALVPLCDAPPSFCVSAPCGGVFETMALNGDRASLWEFPYV